MTFVSLILFLFWPQPRGALWEIEEGGALTLIKFEFPAPGREAAGLLSHHPETLPSHCGSPASLIRPRCHMNYTAATWICCMCMCVFVFNDDGKEKGRS